MRVDEAIAAVAGAICDAADGDLTKDRAEALRDLANAAAALKFGPQGYTGHVDYAYRNQTDYHYTSHDGEARGRPAGFGT